MTGRSKTPDHLELSEDPVFVPGIWCSFASSVMAGLHVTEGGQEVTDKLLQHVARTHQAFKETDASVVDDGVYDAHSRLTEDVVQHREDDPKTSLPAPDVHVRDYHRGNRRLGHFFITSQPPTVTPL